MKKILLLVFVLFGMESVFAECSMNGMQFFPEQKEIPLHSKFIIQGYALSQKTITSFKNRTVYLESESGELIVLNLQELLTGKMELTQAIFSPASALKPNTIYFLNYSDQTENEGREMMQYNRVKNVREKVYWKTTDQNFVESLPTNLTLVFEKTAVIHYGCGPHANAIFEIKNKPVGEIWYKTEVIELETNTKTVFYIKEENGKLHVGHDMCSGAFTFKNKGTYQVRFTPMNIDGQSLKTTDWISFVSPFANDKSRFGN